MELDGHGGRQAERGAHISLSAEERVVVRSPQSRASAGAAERLMKRLDLICSASPPHHRMKISLSFSLLAYKFTANPSTSDRQVVQYKLSFVFDVLMYAPIQSGGRRRRKSWAKHGGEQSTSSLLFFLFNEQDTIYVVEEGRWPDGVNIKVYIYTRGRFNIFFGYLAQFIQVEHHQRRTFLLLPTLYIYFFSLDVVPL